MACETMRSDVIGLCQEAYGAMGIIRSVTRCGGDDAIGAAHPGFRGLAGQPPEWNRHGKFLTFEAIAASG